MTRFLGVCIGVLICVGLAGCIPGDLPATMPTQILVPFTATPQPEPTMSVVLGTELPEPADVRADSSLEATVPAQATVVGLVVADLAAQLDIDSRSISVGLVEELVWSALTCEADIAPISAADRVPGFRITLMVDGVQYTYRADHDGRFVQCDDDSVMTGEPVILDTNLISLIDIASQDLASRLDLPVRRVFLADAQSIMWPDARLGCALTDETWPPTPVAGYRIVLRVGSESYSYHANYRQVSLCPAAAVRLPTAVPSAEDAAAED